MFWLIRMKNGHSINTPTSNVEENAALTKRGVKMGLGEWNSTFYVRNMDSKHFERLQH